MVTSRIGALGLCLLVSLVWTRPVSAQSTTCPAANPGDFVSDDGALNACLNAGGTITLQMGWPGYIVETGLVLSVSNTVLQGVPTKPAIVAHPALAAPILRVPQSIWPTGWTIRDLYFDGNRPNRPTSLCNGSYQDRTRGYNLQLKGTGWTIERVRSDNTLCGSGMEVEGIAYTIRDNRVSNSGAPYNVAPYPTATSDGITLANCHGGLVTGNVIVNASDVPLIVGPGFGCIVENNTVEQSTLGTVGIMIGFASDHSGSVVRNNLVVGSPGMLPIGILIGDHPYNAPTMTHAGTIESNHITGAMVFIAVDGISNGSVLNNTGANQDLSPFPWSPCPPAAYTAGHFGSATLQPGWVPRTYHSETCQ